MARASSCRSTFHDAERHFYAGEYARLRDDLEAGAARSPLPDEPAGRAALNALLIAIRRAHA